MIISTIIYFLLILLIIFKSLYNFILLKPINNEKKNINFLGNSILFNSVFYINIQKINSFSIFINFLIIFLFNLFYLLNFEILSPPVFCMENSEADSIKIEKFSEIKDLDVQLFINEDDDIVDLEGSLYMIENIIDYRSLFFNAGSIYCSGPSLDNCKNTLAKDFSEDMLNITNLILNSLDSLNSIQCLSVDNSLEYLNSLKDTVYSLLNSTHNTYKIMDQLYLTSMQKNYNSIYFSKMHPVFHLNEIQSIVCSYLPYNKIFNDFNSNIFGFYSFLDILNKNIDNNISILEKEIPPSEPLVLLSIKGEMPILDKSKINNTINYNPNGIYVRYPTSFWLENNFLPLEKETQVIYYNSSFISGVINENLGYSIFLDEESKSEENEIPGGLKRNRTDSFDSDSDKNQSIKKLKN